jgi:hypothetical protein
VTRPNVLCCWTYSAFLVTVAARALEFLPPYRPVPGIPVYHVSVGDQVILVAEHDLGGPLLNLVTAVRALDSGN